MGKRKQTSNTIYWVMETDFGIYCTTRQLKKIEKEERDTLILTLDRDECWEFIPSDNCIALTHDLKPCDITDLKVNVRRQHVERKIKGNACLVRGKGENIEGSIRLRRAPKKTLNPWCDLATSELDDMPTPSISGIPPNHTHPIGVTASSEKPYVYINSEEALGQEGSDNKVYVSADCKEVAASGKNIPCKSPEIKFLKYFKEHRMNEDNLSLGEIAEHLGFSCDRYLYPSQALPNSSNFVLEKVSVSGCIDKYRVKNQVVFK